MSKKGLWKLMFPCALGLILSLTLSTWARWQPRGHLESYEKLHSETMSHIWGADGCYGCRYLGSRLDECYHESWSDPCDPTGCIANYAIDNTCDLGTGTCRAFKDNTAVGSVQYYRADSGCTTSNPTKWTAWLTQYYGSTCSTLTHNVRCQKTNGSCNGSLIDISAIEPGIECY